MRFNANRERERRQARRALSAIGVGLRVDTSGFYRPAIRPDPRQKCQPQLGKPEQLFLNFNAPPAPAEPRKWNPERPLEDIFPEAYQ